MSRFQKAPIAPDATITLETGTRFFLDTQSERWAHVLPFFLEHFKKEEFGDQIVSGRGQIMVEIIPSRSVLIPRTVSLETGPFYILPDGVTLGDASNALYGTSERAEMGFWDWLVQNHPKAVASMTEKADTVVRAVKAASTSSLDIAKFIGFGAGAMVILLLLTKRNR